MPREDKSYAQLLLRMRWAPLALDNRKVIISQNKKSEEGCTLQGCCLRAQGITSLGVLPIWDLASLGLPCLGPPDSQRHHQTEQGHPASPSQEQGGTFPEAQRTVPPGSMAGTGAYHCQ